MNRAATRLALALGACLALSASARAHFPWLATDAEGRVLYFFGEHIAERTYHLPESLTTAEVFHVDGDGATKPVALERLEDEAFNGCRSADALPSTGILRSTAVYGIHRGLKLTYYTQHLLDADSSKWPAEPCAELDLQAIVEREEGGVAVQVLWQGKPLADAKVGLYCDDGHEEGSATTDAEGIVRFTSGEVEEGLNGVLVGFVNKDSAGDFNGQAYSGEANYLTITFVDNR